MAKLLNTEEWWRIFSLRCLPFPFLLENRCIRMENLYIGFTDVRVFGIRIARIGRTRPWE